MSDDSRFRPDLEGLRAVAVVLVLLYHAGVPFFEGGYVGVDVFFVLSGFLITGIIVRELETTGRIGLAGFYARRARRLLPAAALVLVVTMVASLIVLPALRVPDVALDAASAAVYVSNIRFALEATDYLGAELAPSPVLHFWSLSVEEQFYLFWPTLLAVTAGVTFLTGRSDAGIRRLAWVLGIVFVGSLGLGVWLTEVNQPWAFFSLTSRAWELALGGLLALVPAGRFVPARIARPMGWVGLAMIVLAGLAFDEATAFPGTAALVPTLGSALVIGAGLGSAAMTRPRVVAGWWLGLPPMRFLGRISYSLYLWHWPILVLAAAASETPLRLAARLGLVGVAIVAAVATQRWVEDPIRRGRIVGLRPRRSLAMAGVLSGAVVIMTATIGLAAVATVKPAGPAIGGSITEVALPSETTLTVGASGAHDPGPDPSPADKIPVPVDLVPALDVARDDLPEIYADGCHLDVMTVTPDACAFGDVDSRVTVVLYGDSHAAQWFPALERLANEQRWRLVSLTKSACTTAEIGVWNAIVKRAYDECAAWRDAVLTRLRTEQPQLVVVSNSNGYRLSVGDEWRPAREAPEAWDAATARTLERLSDVADHVVVIGDTPRGTSDPPVCLSAHLDDAHACGRPIEEATDPAWTTGEAEVAARAGVTFIDPTPWICHAGFCPAVLGRLLVFRDQHHLTATYVRALAERLYARLPGLDP